MKVEGLGKKSFSLLPLNRLTRLVDLHAQRWKKASHDINR